MKSPRASTCPRILRDLHRDVDRQDVAPRVASYRRGLGPYPARQIDGMAAFGRRVRELRGLTQEPSVALSGLHRTYIWGIEQGRRNPSLINIVRIAAALGLKVGDLFD
jgi:DNA-binding XRE family transcriptional regulator